MNQVRINRWEVNLKFSKEQNQEKANLQFVSK